MKIALVQRNITIGDFPGIERTYKSAWEDAKNRGADLVVFPELATTGYPPRDLLAREKFVQENLDLVERMAAWTQAGPAILVGFVEPNDSKSGNDFYNSAAILDEGQVQQTIQKSLLPSYDVFDEDRYFEHGTTRSLAVIRGIKVGITICEDIWCSPEHWNRVRYPVDPCAELAGLGAECFINISASPFALGKADVRRDLVSKVAAEHAIPTVYVNQIGAHDELIFDGHSIAVNHKGELVAELAPFQEDLQIVDFSDNPKPIEATSRQERKSEEEEAYRALVLGVRDYVLKTGFRTVVLGLSGGIDSALTATIAVDALGAENVYGLAMPTRFSSAHSVEDAQALASNLGCGYGLTSIDDTYQAFLNQMKGHFEGLQEDVTEENIQARTRGVTLMALSNKTGALLLTTGNKSEMAVGYCTLYGDMCGALAVIADVPKTLVYRISNWVNRNGERIPQRTIDKPPSAELRPDQVDQDSLPEYEILDTIIEGVVERCMTSQDIAQANGYPLEEVQRIVRLIHLNEYKRRQAPPVLKITSKAFGVGRRMPLVAKNTPWS